MAGQVGLTAKEMQELDGADGVSDGKFHGVEIADLKHDLDKSTEGWEQRPDGKWYKRDYYSASKQQQQVAVTDQRDQIIATLRRELAEKDAIIAELRLTISQKITIIARLESERTQYLSVISNLEEQLRIAQANQQVVVQQPVQVQQVDAGNSYYVVRSQRGAELLSQYGKRDIVIQPHLEPPPVVVGGGFSAMNTMMMPPPMFAPPPVVVPDWGAMVPVQMEQQAIVVQQPQVQQVVTQQIQAEPRVQAKVSEQEYYRVADEEARRRLDMMDGKMDGKLNGTDIRLTGAAGGMIGGSRAASSGNFSMQMSGGGGGGSVSQSQAEYYRVADAEALKRLDAMDGKIDGKFNGTDIQINAGSGSFGAAGGAFGGAAGAFGGGHATSSSYSMSTGTIGGGMAMGAMGGAGAIGGSQTQAEYYRVADAEALRRLDAMDGKIDGKFQGTDIQIK